jgi:hypothetical protein
MNPEFKKLDLLNHFLSIEVLPAYDKSMMVYEKVLEEVG